MPLGLKRYQQEGDDHFITFSCYNRNPYLNTQASRDIFLDSLERTSRSLSVSTPRLRRHARARSPPHERTSRRSLSKALQALKISASRRLAQRPFWQPRYYDFNVFTHNKRVEKLKYMHRNPVTRGLVERPEDWRWSSYRHYLLDEPGSVRISRL